MANQNPMVQAAFVGRNESTPKVLAVDVGYGNTKAVWASSINRSFLPEGKWGESIFKSVAPKIWGEPDSDLSNLDRVMVPVAGERYWVGPGAAVTGVEDGVIEQSVHNIETNEYQALVAGAWSYMMKDLGEVVTKLDTLILGLPVSRFKSHRDKLKEIATRKFLVPLPSNVQSGSATQYVECEAKRVIVLPQPYGALTLAKESFAELRSPDVTTLVIDPGYSTFDWLVTAEGQIRIELCDSFDGGVSNLFAAVANRISKDHGCGSPSFSLLDTSFKRGEIILGGQRISLAPYLETLRQSADSIVGEFLRRFSPESVGITNIVLAGGGASYFKESLERRLPAYKIVVLENSVMSNARGFYLAGS